MKLLVQLGRLSTLEATYMMQKKDSRRYWKLSKKQQRLINRPSDRRFLPKAVSSGRKIETGCLSNGCSGRGVISGWNSEIFPIGDESLVMKQITFSRFFIVVACVLLFCALRPAALSADTAQYFYDPLGRLAAVVDGQGNVATYHYDKVGNLLSISRAPLTSPTITAVTPSVVDAGNSVPMTITGTGFLVSTVSLGNPDIVFSIHSLTDTAITLSVTVPNPTASGPNTVTVRNPGGAALGTFVLHQPSVVLTSLVPNIGGPGTTVVVSGSGFGTKPGSNRVTFAGPGNTRVPAIVTAQSRANLTAQVPAGVIGGSVRVEVGPLTSNALTFSAVGVVHAIAATAGTGVPANSAVASANTGQVIQLIGEGLTTHTRVHFSGIDSSGASIVETANIVAINSDNTSGSVTVPPMATTGVVSTQVGALPAIYPGPPLQIVPAITVANVATGSVFAPGTILTISGSGFKEGATTVLFSGVAAAVPATDVLTGGSGNDRLTVTIPAGTNGVSYAVITDGGTSNTRQFGALQAIIAVAPRGTPQNPAQPSANVGQAIALQGVGFGPGSQAIFTSTTDTGASGLVAAPLININAAGTTANVIVPATATSGLVSVDGQGAVPLQIVPTVFTLTLPAGQNFAPGVVATFGGTGFKEGATTVTFPGASPVAASDVTSSNSRLTVTIPSGAVAGTITVTADGHIGVFDTTRPSVKQVLPFNGQQNVPLNARIAVLFDEPIQPATVTTGSLFVTGPNGFVQGTVAVSSDQQTAIFTPTQPLEATHGYAVSFSTAITDLAGNALNPGATTFATGTSSDTTAPIVTHTSPQRDATSVPTNAIIRAYFSESLLNTTVTSQTVTLLAGGVLVPATVLLEHNNTVARLQPSVPLQANTLYTITVTPTVEDLSGNPFGTQFTSPFNTGAGADTTAPTVQTRTPDDGASTVQPDTTILVTFSEPIEPATVNATTTFTLTGGGISGTVPGTFTFESGDHAVRFTPLFPLFAGQTFFVTLSGVEDRAGNPLGATTSTFTIRADSTGPVVPVVATVIPTPDALFANGQTITRVTIDNIADSNGFLVPDGTQIAVTAAPAYQQTSAGGTIRGGTLSPADPRFKIFTVANGRVRFDYQSPALVLAPGFSAEGIIQVASVTTSGAPASMIGNSPVMLVTSQTASITFNPPVLLPNGSNQAEIHVVVRDPSVTLDDFGRPIPAGTTMGVGVLSQAGPLGTINGGQVAPDPRYHLFPAKTGGIIDFTYTAPNLVQSPLDQALETFSVVPVAPGGNQLGAFGANSLVLYTGGCAFGECVPGGFTGPLPQLLAISPAYGDYDVGTTAPIVAEFSQSLDPTSVTSLTFAVTSGGTPISGTYALSAGSKGPNTIVTFTPSAPWTPETFVNVALTTGITNSAGRPLLTSEFAGFSTGTGPDGTGPSVVRASVGNGLTNVPHSAVINVLFNQPVNLVTLNNMTFTVSAGGTPISGRIKPTHDQVGANAIATFIQDQLLASDTLYTISVTNGVTDSSGNPLVTPFTSTFRTAAGTPVTDVGQPSIDHVTPPDEQREVPINAHIDVRTDKPINPITLEGGFLVTASVGEGELVEGTTTVAGDQTGWTFIPTQTFRPNFNHRVQISQTVRDIAGNPLTSGPGISFSTGTGTANSAGPQMIAVTPPANATNVYLNQPLKVRFSEPLAPQTVTTQTVLVTRGGAPVSGVVTLQDDNHTIRWVPASGGILAPQALHTLTITIGVTGLAANPLSAPLTFSFTTGTATDTAGPVLVSTLPANNDVDVSRTSPIELTFDEPIDPESLFLGETIQIQFPTGAGIGSVVGSVTTSPDGRRVIITPSFPLFSNTSYTVRLEGITDPVGNSVDFTSFSFTTGVAPGTDLNALVACCPSFSVNPSSLTADGVETATVIVSDLVGMNGNPIPDGTLVAVTAQPAFFPFSDGGSIIGGAASPTDSRFKLFPTVGGSITFQYQGPVLTGCGSGILQLVNVDAAGSPMAMIESVFVELIGSDCAH